MVKHLTKFTIIYSFRRCNNWNTIGSMILLVYSYTCTCTAEKRRRDAAREKRKNGVQKDRANKKSCNYNGVIGGHLSSFVITFPRTIKFDQKKKKKKCNASFLE